MHHDLQRRKVPTFISQKWQYSVIPSEISCHKRTGPWQGFGIRPVSKKSFDHNTPHQKNLPQVNHTSVPQSHYLYRANHGLDLLTPPGPLSPLPSPSSTRPLFVMYSSPSVAPRSILKQHYVPDQVYSPPRSPDKLHAVHFPPSPTLTRVYVAHSSTAYDRSPIVVLPNACALPQRGCPGRTYTLDDEPPKRSSPSKRRPINGNHSHPRAASNRTSSPPRPVEDDPIHVPMRASSLVPPPLIPDLSSESDESDGFITLPPSLSTSMTPAPSIPKPRIRGDNMIMSRNDTYSEQFASFGNCSPLPSYRSSPEDRARRRRHRDRSHERERNHRQYSSVSDEGSSRCYKPFTFHTGYALDGADDSCLGGF